MINANRARRLVLATSQSALRVRMTQFCASGGWGMPVNERRGVTLIELLVVIMIMLMITAVTIPVIAPAMQNRGIREAARAVDSYISGARSRALQAQRPYGVMLQREPNNPNAVSTLSYVEQPDDYIGDYFNSGIRLLGNGGFGAWQSAGGPNGFVVSATDPVFLLGDVGWFNNIAPGDIMTIGTTPYRIYAGEPFIDLDGNGTWTPGGATGSPPAEPFRDVDGNGTWTPPNGATIDAATGYFTNTYLNQLPTFQYGTGGATGGAYITYMYADPVKAASAMDSAGGTGLPFISPVSQDQWTKPLPPNTPQPIPNSSQAWGFAITRRPVKTAAPSLQLPPEVVIDLGATYPDQQYGTAVPIPGSGMEIVLAQQNAAGYWSEFRANPSLDPSLPGSLASTNPSMSDPTSVMVTFAANGMVDKVYSWSEAQMSGGTSTAQLQTPPNPSDWQGRFPVSTIYLLIGRRDLVNGDPDLKQKILGTNVPPLSPIFNVQDSNALWVAINPRNGQVATTENVGFDLTQSIPTNASWTPPAGTITMQQYFAANVYYARRLAREQLDMIGR